jgi:succinylglutamate-semialdehyde dehydrogenase
MSEKQFRGDYIGGAFVPPSGGAPFASRDPATAEGDVVLEAVGDAAAVDAAVAAALEAQRGWRRAGLDARVEALRAVQARVPQHTERIAQAITAEMGKPIAEARGEAASIASKIDGVIEQLPFELPPAPPGAPGEQRFHPLGVVAVIGPFNFPVHLLNTHVIPTLLTGNTVVAKPSELTPLAGQRYAELFADAGFPAGVFNLVHGVGDTGAALVAHPDVRGVVFTGSYATGRRIRQATFDQPFKKVCLELGGKNPAVVLDDADLEQAVREILLGALLTTGQRCTATSRVIATPGIADALEDRLVEAFRRIAPGDPKDAACFMGPLASHGGRDRFLKQLEAARAEGAEALVEVRSLPGGAYVTPGLYRVRGGEATLAEELFGPHVGFERAADLDDACRRAADTPFGLSASLFSADPAAWEAFYDQVPAGVVNINRSTNGASGLLPFGGVGMSGNWRPAGSLAPRNATYPVAYMRADLGARTPNAALDGQLGDNA